MVRTVHVHIHRGTRDAGPDAALRALYEDLAQRMCRAARDLVARTGDNAAWHEEQHPRAPDGRFGNKAGEHHAPEADGPLPKGSGMDALRALFATGKPFTREELLAATGLKDKKLTDYLAMLKNPKYAGPKGALKIEKMSDGRFRVVTEQGNVAPPMPPAPPPFKPAAPPAPPPEVVKQRTVEMVPPTPPADMDERTAHYRKHAEEAHAALTKLAQQYGLDHMRVVHAGGQHITVDFNAHGMTLEQRKNAVTKIRSALPDKFDYEPGMAFTPPLVFKVPEYQPPRPAARALPREWKPAKTAKEVTERAVKEGWCDAADFGRMSPEAANEYMTSVAEHFSEFPGLRKQRWFFGTNAGYKKHYVQERAKDVTAQLVAKGITDPEAIAKNVKWHARPPSIPTKAWALAWQGGLVRGRAITVNEKFSTDMEPSRKELKRNVDSGFHPPGCDTHKSVMDHEMGHQLDYLLNLRKHPEVSSMWSQAMAARRHPVIPDDSAVSKYGVKNPAEFIAELWAEAKNAPQPRPLAKRMAAIIRSEYARQFGKSS